MGQNESKYMACGSRNDVSFRARNLNCVLWASYIRAGINEANEVNLLFPANEKHFQIRKRKVITFVSSPLKICVLHILVFKLKNESQPVEYPHF
jgi:hypothetical protein